MSDLISVVARDVIRHDQLGFIKQGQHFKVTPRQLAQLQALGVIDVPVEVYNTKVITGNPLSGRGEDAPSSVSQAAPVSPQTTSKPSKRGGKAAKTGE